MEVPPSPVPPGQPRLGTGKKLLFSLFTCVLFFAALEVGWRLAHGWHRHWLDCHRAHPLLGWSLREGWAGKYSWTGGHSRINAQGIRDDQPVGPKAPGEKRLLALGDSNTFGAKVRTGEAYPAQLEQALRQRGKFWRVLNGGVTSYDPSQEADWLELFGWGLEPDVLAVGFSRNDLHASARVRKNAQGAVGPAGRWLTEHSIVAYKLHRGMGYLLARLGWASATRDVATAEANGDKTSSGWPLVEESYRRIARHAQQRQTPVVLIIFPTRDLLEGKASDNLSERLEALGQELGWPVIDLAAAFQNEPASLFPGDDPVHPNAAGYRQAAQHLARGLTERNILP